MTLKLQVSKKNGINEKGRNVITAAAMFFLKFPSLLITGYVMKMMSYHQLSRALVPAVRSACHRGMRSFSEARGERWVDGCGSHKQVPQPHGERSVRWKCTLADCFLLFLFFFLSGAGESVSRTTFAPPENCTGQIEAR